jgi:hypothetical protein
VDVRHTRDARDWSSGVERGVRYRLGRATSRASGHSRLILVFHGPGLFFPPGVDEAHGLPVVSHGRAQMSTYHDVVIEDTDSQKGRSDSDG